MPSTEVDGYDYALGPEVELWHTLDLFDQPRGAASRLALEAIELFRPAIRPLCIRMYLGTRCLPNGWLKRGFAEPHLWRISEPVPPTMTPPFEIHDGTVETHVPELTPDALAHWVDRALEQPTSNECVVALKNFEVECGLVYLGEDEVTIHYRGEDLHLRGDDGWFPLAWPGPLWALCELQVGNCESGVDIRFFAGCSAWRDAHSPAGQRFLRCARNAAERGWGVSYSGRNWPIEDWTDIPRALVGE